MSRAFVAFILFACSSKDSSGLLLGSKSQSRKAGKIKLAKLQRRSSQQWRFFYAQAEKHFSDKPNSNEKVEILMKESKDLRIADLQENAAVAACEKAVELKENVIADVCKTVLESREKLIVVAD